MNKLDLIRRGHAPKLSSPVDTLENGGARGPLKRTALEVYGVISNIVFGQIIQTIGLNIPVVSVRNPIYRRVSTTLWQKYRMEDR